MRSSSIYTFVPFAHAVPSGRREECSGSAQIELITLLSSFRAYRRALHTRLLFTIIVSRVHYSICPILLLCMVELATFHILTAYVHEAPWFGYCFYRVLAAASLMRLGANGWWLMHVAMRLHHVAPCG